MSDDDFSIGGGGARFDAEVTESTGVRAHDVAAHAGLRFSLRSLLVVTAVVAFIAFGMVCIQRVAEAHRRRVEIRNSLKQIWLGLVNYESAFGRLPPPMRISATGAPLSSWRLANVRFMEQLPIDGSIPLQLNVAWNAPVHQKLANYFSRAYCWSNSPSDLSTNVFAITGPGTAFDESNKIDLDNVDGDVVIDRDLVFVLETSNSRIHWMQPGDYDVVDLLAATGKLGDTVKGILPDRIHVLFADGKVWALSPDTPMESFKPFLTVVAAKTASREELLGPYRVD